MKKSVRITINGKHIDQDENIEMIVMGSLYEKDNKYYITYQDYSLDDSSSTNTTIKIDGTNRVTIIRYGAVTTTMVFDDINEAIYETPLGTFYLQIKTEKITLDYSRAGLYLKIDYSLSINGMPNEKALFEVHAEASGD